MRIGILALQGAFIEHKFALDALGIESFEIRQKRDIEKPFDGLIIPGGESTVIGKLLRQLDLFEPIKEMIENGMPVFGTCAGLIVLAKNIEGENPHLGVMDISVRRNAYGKQIDSFSNEALIPEISAVPFPLVFIRAPWIDSVGENVQVFCELNGHIVAARENNMLVTSFHPELTKNTAFHEYFINMIKGE
ncbi:MAG: pyridoxal 5'-phosphate synthase glutaminase subunit PdxT [Oscillospiraceae bacterium]|nr:pyridoxal 5'-phosphate synthase glutaminase subunit PdxT [Oscillospiraceae bacterium]